LDIDEFRYITQIFMLRITPDPTGRDAPRPEQLIDELYAIIEKNEPKPHWSAQSKSLVMRLRGIYAIGPDALQMGPDDTPEFGWRTFENLPPIHYEAAQHIQELEEELQKYRERFFRQECDLRNIQTDVSKIKAHYTFPKDV